MSKTKHFQSRRNLINAQMEQAKTHHNIKDEDRPTLIEAYELQLKKVDEEEKAYRDALEVEQDEI